MCRAARAASHRCLRRRDAPVDACIVDLYERRVDLVLGAELIDCAAALGERVVVVDYDVRAGRKLVVRVYLMCQVGGRDEERMPSCR